MNPLIAYNINVLNRLDQLLVQMDNSLLQQSDELLFGSTIGQHFRHILEFYECLLAGLPYGVFSYDKRKRNHAIESDIVVARLSIRNSLDGLYQLTSDRPLTMESELPGLENLVQHDTSLMRELAYCADHGVHHLAIIRIALEQHHPEIQFEQELGVAASTVNFRNTQKG